MKQHKQAQSLAQIAAIHQQLDELETCIREQQLTERRWTFPKDNYTVLAIWLLYDPVAHELFPVSTRKSWAELALRLTDYVGWVVDPEILRQTYNRWAWKKTKFQ